jgi:glycosyltransferase involved in cell wall biosynthesis
MPPAGQAHHADERPLVSVVIPVFNAGPFLEAAVESVRSQTYDRWELILVDDGSRDGSREVAREYAEREAGRIRHAEHPGNANLGSSATRNRGVRLARGSLVAFLDADDVWLPGKLAAQVDLLERHPDVGMLYGATQYWYSWTGKPEDRERDTIPPVGVEATTVIQPPLLLARCVLGQVAVPCPCSIILRREAIDRAGGWEDRFTGMFDDQAFYAKVMLRDRVLVVPECWDRYRRRPDSMYATAKREGTVRAERLGYLAWLREYLAGQGVTSGPVWKAVERASWCERHPRLVRLVGAHRVRRWLGAGD